MLQKQIRTKIDVLLEGLLSSVCCQNTLTELTYWPGRRRGGGGRRDSALANVVLDRDLV